VFRYRIDMATQAEIDADPFGGHGVFLPLPGASGEEMLARLECAFGRVVPAVAAPQQGIWADSGSTGMSPEELLSRWDVPLDG
jgi:hypothetical protein